MDITHKTRNCLNCNTPLSEEENFCPNCGQKNTDYKLTVWELLKEFVTNYIDIDSRFGRSLIPFMFKPGYLTNAFIHGKRMKYVHPVRFYLITSLLFFITLSYVFEINEAKWLPREPDLDAKLKEEYKKDSLDYSLIKIIDEHIDNGVLTEEDGKAIAARMNKEDKMRLLSLKLDQDSTNLETDTLLGANYLYNEDKVYYIWIRQKDMTADALLDSIQASNKNMMNRFAANRLIKLGQNDPNIILVEMIENIPTMVFLLIPIFAFFLKILYIRSKRLYLEHLIFGFHLHTFIYFALTCSMLWAHWVGDGGLFYAIVPLIIIVYTFAMFKRVFKQGWIKTFFKLGILSFVYFFTISFFSVFEVIISFLIF
ncbi:DUF3667 domain-containing protein [Flammeovirgaceae bacterium SG7u.111]|nr:DUF3667 domain-containing protein [Flammeovirgaceae bacterium SG7u.132]WPO36410.1 DUF3667 domain-containing protein [Flammeovirgaceae bacterium SG7u.111]